MTDDGRRAADLVFTEPLLCPKCGEGRQHPQRAPAGTPGIVMTSSHAQEDGSRRRCWRCDTCGWKFQEIISPLPIRWESDAGTVE